MNINSYQPQPIKSFQLLSAIATGNATVDDLADVLKQNGLPFSYSKIRTKTPPDIVSSTVQRVPQIPFYLNGVLYDPKDITRFNGQELHFVPAPSNDHMLVVDNQGIFNSWLRLLLLERNGYSEQAPISQSYPTHNVYSNQALLSSDDLRPPEVPQPGADGDLVPMPPFSLFSVGGMAPREFFFYEHINYKGSQLILGQGRAYKNLTRVKMGLFGNWNDEISSIRRSITASSIVRVFEHINFTGQSLTLFGDGSIEIPSLVPMGWNDRISSITTS
ncbi:hypothetical protein [Bacillus cereus]|uniref:hypothetical protein n=1 Tax=Bacillus cereus TaxID=1396 RepID=UPI000B4BFBBD|nr:hypothetical protein [Bacillus cereus]